MTRSLQAAMPAHSLPGTTASSSSWLFFFRLAAQSVSKGCTYEVPGTLVYLGQLPGTVLALRLWKLFFTVARHVFLLPHYTFHRRGST